jgi:hypothetical protein
MLSSIGIFTQNQQVFSALKSTGSASGTRLALLGSGCSFRGALLSETCFHSTSSSMNLAAALRRLAADGRRTHLITMRPSTR